jgi:DNA modification methylase
MGVDPFYADDWLTVYEGDTLDVMRGMPDGTIHSAITSPPYYGLRDYGLPDSVFGGDKDCSHTWSSDTCSLCGAWKGQLGHEPTPEEYVSHLVEIFAQVRRLLRDDGTFWLNIGDSYSRGSRKDQPKRTGVLANDEDGRYGFELDRPRHAHIKPKDLIGIPWMLAFALRADGWYLRSDIIWSKPNVMPESVDDRPTKAHEYVFLLSKSQSYYYDNEAVKEEMVSTQEQYLRAGKSVRDNHAFGSVGGRPLGDKSFATMPSGRNRRTVWHIAPQPYAGAHYAPFPPKLIEPMILAGTSEGGVCKDCGAPQKRIVKRERAYHHTTTDPGKQPGGPYESQTGSGAGTHDVRHGVLSSTETVGWTPSCEHANETWTPAVILDPFAGSGTTGLVAQALSRRAVLIDLNGEYVRQQLVRNANMPLGL